MICGQTIALKPFESKHVDRTREWVNDPELARLLDRAKPVSDMEHREWFLSLNDRTDCIFFAVETVNENQHLGNVWLANIDWRHRKAELRIVIGEAGYSGRGIGTEAISLLCTYGFRRLNLHKIYAYVLAINPRALRAFEKSGFEIEGELIQDRFVDNHYTDVYLLAVRAEKIRAGVTVQESNRTEPMSLICERKLNPVI